MTAQQAVKQLQYRGSLFDSPYIVHRFWRCGSARCYIFLYDDWRVDSHVLDPYDLRKSMPLLLHAYLFAALPVEMQHSDDWHIYTFAEVIKDSYSFPEGNCYR